MTMTALDKWYGYMKSHDRAASWDLLHPDAVFESPSFTPRTGATSRSKYLSGAEQVLGGPGLPLSRRMARRNRRGSRSSKQRSTESPSTASTSSVSVDDGRIIHFKVMVRPLKAVNLLHRLMGEQLAKQ